MAIETDVSPGQQTDDNGESLRIHQLQTNGAYIENKTSRCLPFLEIPKFVPFLQLDTEVGETTRVRQFVESIRRDPSRGL